jgi:hypothetical protein
MDQRDPPPRTAGGKGCGCLAALTFLIVVGVPVLFMFSFGLSPCKDGPCDPDGARNLGAAAAILLALAALLGLAVWRLVNWRSARRAAPGESGGRGLETAGTALLLVAAAAMVALILL